MNGIYKAITEMVPDLIWAPDFFGPQEIWSPSKFGPSIKKPCDDFRVGTKFIGVHTSWGPNFSGTKKVRGPNEIGDHFS